MENIKCECGHANPVGTVLCESCGKPLDEDETRTSHLEMRYEGMARRSQTFKKTIADEIWNFFSSVKVAIWLIVITLIASILGTVFPQALFIPVPKPPEVYYEEVYGIAGKIYYLLGLHEMYTSWWYVLLLSMIGISLVICSLDRIVPLYRALKKQRAKRHTSFLQRQKISTVYTIENPGEGERILNQLEEALKKRRFQLIREGSSLLGEKGRFSRWGPYVNHIGLIIFLLGVLMRLIPGFYLDEYIWVKDGETKKVPETPYYVKNEDFKLEYYREDEYAEKPDEDSLPVVKNYQTNAVLYIDKNADIPGAEPELVEVKRHSIILNHPLKYEDLLLYQAGQQTNLLFALNLTLVDHTGKELGKFKVDLYDPEDSYQLTDQVKVEVLEYYPDIIFTPDNRPMTLSSEPNNPALIVKVISPKTPEGEKSWIFLGKTLNENGPDRMYDFAFSMPDIGDKTGLFVRKDKSLPVIFVSAFIVMIGLVMGFYWQHRRIWFQLEDDGKLYIAAHTNKNWYGMKKDLLQVLSQAGIDLAYDQLNKGGNRDA
jgi:cytochrome c biogenesis protein